MVFAVSAPTPAVSATRHYYRPSAGFFCNIGVPPPAPPAPVPQITNVSGSDTFRGGANLVVTLDTNVYDTSRDRSLATAPAGWTSTGTLTYVSTGVELSGTSSLVTDTAEYDYFDVAVNVTPLQPVTDPGVLTRIASLEHTVGAETARVSLVRGAGATPNKLVVLYETPTAAGFSAIASMPNNTLTLRIVRNGNALYLTTATRLAGTAELYTTENKPFSLAVPSFGTTAGVMRLTTAGSGVARFNNFTVRHHVSINGRLLDRKVVHGRQIRGKVPAAQLSEVGAANISAFGLTGSHTANSFTYTYPAPRTVGNEVVRTINTYQDPVVRNRSS